MPDKLTMVGNRLTGPAVVSLGEATFVGGISRCGRCLEVWSSHPSLIGMRSSPFIASSQHNNFWKCCICRLVCEPRLQIALIAIIDFDDVMANEACTTNTIVNWTGSAQKYQIPCWTFLSVSSGLCQNRNPCQHGENDIWAQGHSQAMFTVFLAFSTEVIPKPENVAAYRGNAKSHKMCASLPICQFQPPPGRPSFIYCSSNLWSCSCRIYNTGFAAILQFTQKVAAFATCCLSCWTPGSVKSESLIPTRSKFLLRVVPSHFRLRGFTNFLPQQKAILVTESSWQQIANGFQFGKPQQFTICVRGQSVG